jgi:hypothetical protein
MADEILNNVELKEEELEEVSGGKISFEKRPDKAGWIQHKVTASDTLIRIANQYGISDWRKIRDWNPHISHKTNMIRTGEWLWIKR